jgi:hypothetical protein
LLLAVAASAAAAASLACCAHLVTHLLTIKHPVITSLLFAGGTAQEVGGPFDKEGSVGHKFTTDGGIGEWLQNEISMLQQADAWAARALWS